MVVDHREIQHERSVHVEGVTAEEGAIGPPAVTVMTMILLERPITRQVQEEHQTGCIVSKQVVDVGEMLGPPKVILVTNPKPSCPG